MAVPREVVALQSELEIEPLNEDDIRRILRAHPKISSHISEALFTHVSQRQLTIEQYCDLKTEVCPSDDCESWQARLAARGSRLAPYVGKPLVCIYIRFPAAHFTVEIDPLTSTVVHFEGQAT